MKFSKRIKRMVKELLFGMFGFEIMTYILKSKKRREDIFMVMVFGDILGIPLFSNYYSLRLLPYIVPMVENWKERILKEKDFIEKIAEEEDFEV